MEYNILVSPNAIKKIKEQLKKTSNIFLRLGVKGGSCAGYSYIIEFTNDLSNRDIIFNIEDIQIVIDNKSINYLNNCELDWNKSLMNIGFIIKNPLAKTSCGCGLSFSI